MGYPPLEQQLRTYGEAAYAREAAGSLMPTRPTSAGTRAGGSRRSWALVAAMVVFIAGLSAVAIATNRSSSSPTAARVDRNDQDTIAGYIAQSSRALSGLEVGDPCPNWAVLDKSGLNMIPVSVGIQGEDSCRVVGWIPRGIPGLSEQEDHFNQDGSLLGGSVTPTTAGPASATPAVLNIRVIPPESVPAGLPWRLSIEGNCAAGPPGSGNEQGLPPEACATSSVAIVRGPDDREVMSSGGLAQLSELGAMPPLGSGETLSFHLVVVAVDSAGNEADYRLPAQGDYVVVGR